MKCGSRSCTKDFTPVSENHRYCSRTCGQREYSATLYGSGPMPSALTCARSECGKPFTPRAKHQRYCSMRCGIRSYNALSKDEREARKNTKVHRHPNTEFIHALRQDVGPMRCVYCEARLTSVKAYICDDRECRASYQRDYAAARRKRARELRPITTPTERTCKCGCGARFVPAYPTQLFITTEHTRRHVHRVWYARRAKTRAAGPRKVRGKGILFAGGRRLAGREYAAV